MNTNKFLLGGIAGGVAFFLLGWLCYGMLLKDFFAENVGSAGNVMKDEKDFILWALIVGNLITGFLYAYVLGKANASSVTSGASVGAVVGLLFAAGWDFVMYGVANLNNMTATLADIGVWTVISAITGAIIGWINGMGKKAVA